MQRTPYLGGSGSTERAKSPYFEAPSNSHAEQISMARGETLGHATTSASTLRDAESVLLFKAIIVHTLQRCSKVLG